VPEYLFVSSDLTSAGKFADDRLAEATDRHRMGIERPPLAATSALIQVAAETDGAVLSVERGFLINAQLSFIAAVIGAGKRAWLYWPRECVVEAVDADRLPSLKRHRWALLAYERIVVPGQRVKHAYRRLPAALRWIYRGEFPIRRYDVRHNLEWFIARASPVPFRAPAEARRGTGAYLRTDFWVRIESGGSYGHTSYVAKELAERSARFVCYLPQRYTLLDRWGIHQVVLDPPTAHTTGEDPIIGATDHYLPLLRAAFLTLRPDFIYERICLGNYAGALLSGELRIPYVVEYNGSEISMSRSFQHRSPFYEHEYLQAETAAFEQATVISVISTQVRDDVIRRGVDAAKVLVNPNGADTDAYAPPTREEKNAIRAELGFGPDDCIVGFTGTFGGWHGIDVLAAALPTLCAQTDARFLLIGDGSHKHLVDAAVVEHRLQDRVRSTGRVPQDEGARLLRACDIFVSPHSSHMVDSRFFGSPTKLFEYMAMGGGIVASDLEQIGEVLSPGLRSADVKHGTPSVGAERAVLCTPGNVEEFVDGVVALIRNRSLREALGRNARAAVVQHFSWKRHVERLWEFIDELERRRPARLSVAPDRPIATGDAYKDEVQRQWDHNPAGSQHGGHAEPATLDWFLQVEAHRYGEYAPWMPRTMEFAKHAGKDVLEVGGGMGTDLAQFAKHGARVTDVDLSAGHLALAEQNFRLRGLDGRFVHQDAERLPFDDDSFDVVYSNGVIHHTPHTDRVVAEMRRVLRPGGRAIVMVYAENSLHYWRNLILNVGLRRGELLSSSAGDILSRVVERSDNDARPLVKVYTKARLRKLFAAFTDIEIVQRQMMPAELPKRLRRFLPQIERVAGWNLIVKANKPR
jgi:glycosyltransferase involved in cell wall biosynthesis/ubiquinone/menaquinone biosynthesis C-methylase UbiE